MGVISYKCPNCGAEVKFNPDTQMGLCEFCMTSFKIDELEKLNSKNYGDLYSDKTQDNNVYKTNVYNCPRCGAQIITDKTTSATFCCYCQGPVVLSDNLSGEFKPAKIIPFKIKKDDAVSKIQKWLGGKWFLPNVFHNYKQLEKVTGVYIPFWITSSKVNGNLKARCKKITYWSDSEYDYTKTDTYEVKRVATMNFNNIPNNASSKMDDEVMQNIEPYNDKSFVDFNMAYLTGFISEKYDKTKEDVMPIIEKRLKDGTEEILRSSMSNYTSISIEKFDTKFDDFKCEYGLLPVWMITYSVHNKEYIFAVNGETGETFGALPVSKAKLFILFTVGTLVGMLISCIGGLFI